jgi:hypothetical protein
MKTVHVFGNLDAGMFCELTGAGPQIFEEAVRKADGGSTLCYRPIYKIWGCQLRIEFNPRQLTDEDVLTLVQNAGDYCGVGEMRPSKKGLGYGRFAIDQKFPIEAKGVER